MNKSFNTYSTKAQDLFVKDVDESGRKVAVYLSVFDKIDSDMDVIRRGAFNKSIQERGPFSASNRKIAFLRYHDWEKPIGKFVELAEDSKGLFAVGELGTSTLGSDALADYKDGIIREHSIGFNYVKDKVKFIEDLTLDSGGYYEINEVKLWEGSAVTFGANEDTSVEYMKSLNKEFNLENEIEKRLSEMQIITKALSSGEGTDERLFSLEMKHNKLSSEIKALLEIKPLEKKHLMNEEPQRINFDWQKVINSINF